MTQLCLLSCVRYWQLRAKSLLTKKFATVAALTQCTALHKAALACSWKLSLLISASNCPIWLTAAAAIIHQRSHLPPTCDRGLFSNLRQESQHREISLAALQFHPAPNLIVQNRLAAAIESPPGLQAVRRPHPHPARSLSGPAWPPAPPAGVYSHSAHQLSPDSTAELPLTA